MPIRMIYDDGAPLGPITDLRPVFGTRTGVVTTMERWETALGGSIGALWVPDRLAALAGEQHADVRINEDLSSEDDVLLVNGACVLPQGGRTLGPHEWVADEHGRFIAGRLTGAEAMRMVRENAVPERTPTTIADDGPVLERLSDIIRLRDRAIAQDLLHLAPDSAGTLRKTVHRMGTHAVVLGEGSNVGSGAVLDATDGAIYVGPGAVVRPRATLIGPCALLDGATVLDGAVIRGNTVIGPRCKANGEVGGTIFQGNANKGHHGYLGDAYVGEWVNLGAGTTNSNLLNTYADVKAPAHLDDERSPTGLTFLGCVLGDHVKTAIMSRIMTGSVLGTGAMCATTGAPASITPRFAWCTDAGTEVFEWERFVAVARTVMARRGVEPTDAYLDALRTLAKGGA